MSRQVPDKTRTRVPAAADGSAPAPLDLATLRTRTGTAYRDGWEENQIMCGCGRRHHTAAGSGHPGDRPTNLLLAA
jgi:hypothetical protein